MDNNLPVGKIVPLPTHRFEPELLPEPSLPASSRPTKPGFYWAKQDGRWVVVEVWKDDPDGMSWTVLVTGDDRTRQIGSFTDWRGPLTPPANLR